jgi:hypothetical protein
VERIEGNDPVAQVEFGQKLLGGGDFVRLFIDFDMGDGQRRVRRERAQYLLGGPVVERVEAAAQHLAVDRKNAAPARFSGRRGVQGSRMGAKDGLDVGGLETADDRADRRMRRGLLPAQPEGFAQPLEMNLDEGLYTPIRVSPGHDRQDRKQQNIALLVALAFGAPGIGNHLEPGQDRSEGLHGDNLRICFNRRA